MQNVHGRSQRGFDWRRLGLVISVAILIVTMTAPSVLAWGRSRDNDPEPMRKAKCLDRAPTLHFNRGTLSRDGFRGWLLNNTPVVFTSESRITDQLNPTREASPVEGRIAVVTGPRVGTTIIVRQAVLLDPWAEIEVNVTAQPGEAESVIPPGVNVAH